MGENTFIVTPMNQTFNLVPGKTYTGSITVLNPSSSVDDFNYQVSVSPYSVADEDYSADLATISNRSMMKEWIKIDEPSGTLKPNESKKVSFTINVPATAPGGGQYAALLVSNSASSEDGQKSIVNNAYEIASLVYANVAGDIKHEGEILENNLPAFVLSTPIKVGALITNTGNAHESAVTILEVKNNLTGEIILPTEQNTGRYNEVIIPETTRRTEYDIVDLPVVGVVKVSQTIYYNGSYSTESRDVVICPVWFMLLMIMVIGGIIGATIRLIKKRHQRRSIA